MREPTTESWEVGIRRSSWEVRRSCSRWEASGPRRPDWLAGTGCARRPAQPERRASHQGATCMIRRVAGCAHCICSALLGDGAPGTREGKPSSDERGGTLRQCRADSCGCGRRAASSTHRLDVVHEAHCADDPLCAVWKLCFRFQRIP
jgi:hypothetical protein